MNASYICDPLWQKVFIHQKPCFFFWGGGISSSFTWWNSKNSISPLWCARVRQRRKKLLKLPNKETFCTTHVKQYGNAKTIVISVPVMTRKRDTTCLALRYCFTCVVQKVSIITNLLNLLDSDALFRSPCCFFYFFLRNFPLLAFTLLLSRPLGHLRLEIKKKKV